jgi:3-mercaptopropionate dioxygenase
LTRNHVFNRTSNSALRPQQSRSANLVSLGITNNNTHSRYRSDTNHYARNLVYDAPDGSLSLYTLVWLPGQWTPVHDHGSWVSWECWRESWKKVTTCACHRTAGPDEGIHLVRGGVILLGRGAVTSFVPNPDHIHVTGVPPERSRAVSCISTVVC